MATLIGYLQLSPIYAWTPVGGHSDPRAGTTQNGGTVHYLYGAVPEDGTLTFAFGAGDYIVPNVIYITYDQTTDHHYAGTAADPYPVYEDPTPDMYWDYGWQRWWGDFATVGMSYYSDAAYSNIVASSESVPLVAGLFRANDIITLQLPPVPGTIDYPSPGGDHAYEWLVENRSNGGVVSFPIKSPARYFQVGMAHFGNNPYLYPTVVFNNGAVEWSPAWPYEDPNVAHGQPMPSAVRISA